MKWIVRGAFALMSGAVCCTMWLVSALKPTSAGAFCFFAVWLALPYASMGAVLIALRRRRTNAVHWHVVAAAVSVGGVLLLVDAILWRPDAQGAIDVLMTPILQGGASVLLSPIAAWLSRRACAGLGLRTRPMRLFRNRRGR